MLLDIRPDHLEIVRGILRLRVPQYAVWAFGSRVKWTAKDYSDLDLCILSDKPLDFRVLGALTEDFSESDLPYKVDIVDWATTSVSFRKIIEEDKVMIQDKQHLPDVASDMSSNWRKCLLGDVLNLKRGFDLPARDRLPGFIPLISSAGPSDFHNEAKVKAPGVVTGRYGTIGNVYFSKDDFWPLNTTLFVDDFKGNNPRFIYFFLKTIDYFKYSDKGAVPGVNRNHLHTAEVVLPDLLTQNKIAEFLGEIEDRIELLRETNTTLEAIAQALFKSWFVDFDPVRAKQEGREPEGMDAATAKLFPDSFKESELGLIPTGWLVGNLGNNTIYLNRGISPKYLEFGGVLVINQKCIRDFILDLGKSRRHDVAQKKIDGRELLIGDILVNSTGVGTLGRVAQVLSIDEPMIVDSHVTVVRAGESLTWNYLGLSMMQRQSEIEDLGEGSTGQTELSRMKLAILKLVLPGPSVLNKFDQITLPLREKFADNLKQAQTLATLRDTLLPRLISGQLRLLDTGDVIREAA